MPIFVSGRRYEAMEERALLAEARLEEFEAAAEAETARQLKEHNKKSPKKSTRKPSKVVEAPAPVPAQEPVADVEVDEVAQIPVAETTPAPLDRQAEVKRLANEEMTVKQIAEQLNVSQTTVRRDLKK